MSDQTKLQHFIGGEWVAPTSGEYFESTNPATREVLYHAARGNAADVAAAVDSAQATFEDPRWRDLSQTRRGHLLRRLGDLIGEHAEELARSESQDNGKLLREMRGQLTTLPEYYYYYAGLADKIHGAVVPTSDRTVLNYTSREPLGVVGAITPWNSPLTLTTSKLAPALCAGNTVVIKPSEYTSATVLRLAELVDRGRLPAGGGQHRDRVRRRGRAGRWSITLRWPRSRSPAARPRARASRRQRPAGSSGAPWSSAANRPTSCSRTPTSRTPRWVWWRGSSPPRARPASPAAGCSHIGRSTTSCSSG